jgi:hypothetical protein
MRLEAFAALLQEAGLGKAGSTLFCYFMPDDVRQGIVLRIGLIGSPIDHELPGYRPQGTFQLITRAQSYDTAFDLAESAAAVLTLVNEPLGTEYHVNFSRARHEPIIYPRSAGANLEAVINFDINYVVLPV